MYFRHCAWFQGERGQGGSIWDYDSQQKWWLGARPLGFVLLYQWVWLGASDPAAASTSATTLNKLLKLCASQVSHCNNGLIINRKVRRVNIYDALRQCLALNQCFIYRNKHSLKQMNSNYRF